MNKWKLKKDNIAAITFQAKSQYKRDNDPAMK